MSCVGFGVVVVFFWFKGKWKGGDTQLKKMVWKLKGGGGGSNVSCTGFDEWRKKIKRLLINQNTKEWEYSVLIVLIFTYTLLCRCASH